MIKPVEFRCKKTVDKNGIKIKCGKFLCSIGQQIILVCRKCGSRYILDQEEDGRWKMTALATGPIRLSKPKEDNHGRKDNSRECTSI